MTYLQAFLLGALQGFTEFIPISSSGHLKLLQHLFGLQEVPLLFDVSLHIATLIVVVLVFRKKISRLLLNSVKIIKKQTFPEKEETLNLLKALLISTFCTGVLGIIFKSIVEEASPKWVSASLLLTAILLVLGGNKQGKRTYVELTLKDSIIIGISQGFGVLPGISRSGITITTGLLLGFDRKLAGEYSFLLFLPAAFGALLLTLKDASALVNQIPVGVLLSGCISAFLFGLGSLGVLLRILRGGNLGWFAWYLIPVGLGGLLFL
ncbi:MAG: undecaprenyl-diphosphate phosphatase [Spirochaetales bacterium]